jgi:hypothetical protein
MRTKAHITTGIDAVTQVNRLKNTHDAGMWFKCFHGVKTKTLLVDTDGREFNDVLLDIEQALLPDKERQNQRYFDFDYLDDMGQRICLDSTNRLKEALTITDRLQRSFVYLFCEERPPSKVNSHATLRERKDSANDDGKGEAIGKADEICVSDEARVRHLLNHMRPLQQKYHRHSKRQWSDSHFQTNPIIARYQKQIEERERISRLQGHTRQNDESALQSASTLTDQDVLLKSEKSGIVRVDTRRSINDPAWNLLNSHVDARKVGYITRLTSGHLRQRTNDTDTTWEDQTATDSAYVHQDQTQYEESPTADALFDDIAMNEDMSGLQTVPSFYQEEIGSDLHTPYDREDEEILQMLSEIESEMDAPNEQQQLLTHGSRGIVDRSIKPIPEESEILDDKHTYSFVPHPQYRY